MDTAVAASQFDTMWRRAGAFYFDCVIAGTVASWAATAIEIASGASSRNSLVSLVSNLIIPVYFVFCQYRLGGTLGKLLAGLRVRSTRGDDANLSEVMKRYLWLIVCVLAFSGVTAAEAPFSIVLLVIVGLWVAADLYFALRDPQRRSLHDQFAGTTVIFRGYKDS